MLFISRNISAIAVGLITVYSYNGILCDGIAFGGGNFKLHYIPLSKLERICGQKILAVLVQIEIEKLSSIF